MLEYINNIKNEVSHFYSIDDVKKQKRKYGSRKDYNNAIKRQYNKEQEQYIKMIINSNVNFNKLGWAKEVSKIINCKPQKVNKWMKRFMPEFYNDKCFKRSCSTNG